MTPIGRLKSWLTIEKEQPELVVAQFLELQRQVPLLYLLLVINSVAVSYTHFGAAPDILTLWLPAAQSALCLGRVFVWLRRSKGEVEPAEAARRLRKTTALAGILTFVYIAWSLTLTRYGGPEAQGHVALYIAITIMGCIFCLMHLPQAALLVTLVGVIPCIVYYLRMDNLVYTAIALNIFLVTLAMLIVQMRSFASFRQLIHSRVETARLGEENARLAHTDALTGLPNRRYFFAELERRIAAAGEAKTRFAVGILDLDRFKPINDTYGHLFGDRLLSMVGERLQDVGMPGLTVARLGGDEFGFIATAGIEDIEASAQRICDLVIDIYRIDELQVSIGCSCGAAIYPDAGKTVHELFDRSDYALYNSKTTKRGTATLYSVEHEMRIRTDRAIETALHSADLDSEISVHLQPIVDAELGRTVAFESLARWTSPLLGVVRPDIFITAAEKTGLVHALTLVLFRKSLAEIARLPPEFGLSFNLSAYDVSSPKTILALVSTLRQSGVAPSRLTFELTETAVMRDFDIAADSIRLLRSLGSRIALDDFGTGYSSLGHLHRLPMDRVKIDRSFVRELQHPAGHKLVASILGMCRTMGLECVVEGVEEREQFAVLRELGCDLFQGYLFSRPLAPADLPAWLATDPMGFGEPAKAVAAG